jgi:hypothetical protein
MKRLLYAVPLLAVPILLAFHKDDKPAKNEKPMPTVTDPAPRARIDRPRPPIDVDAPAKVETATFALG